MTFPEYLVCLSTFLAIVYLGVQRGLFVGLVLAMFVFVVKYSSAPTVSISSLQQSKVARSYQDRRFLVGCKGSIVSVKPQGYVFFGTAIRLLEEVKKHILTNDTDAPHSVTILPSFTHRIVNSGQCSQKERAYEPNEDSPLLGHNFDVAMELLDDEIPRDNRVEFAVLDFSNVLGVDATAAHSCFLLLTKLLVASKVTPVYTQLSAGVERLLRAQGVLGEGCVYIPHVDDALEWCEDCLLDRYQTDVSLCSSTYFLLFPQLVIGYIQSRL